MSEFWQCALIGEGSSDEALADVLERLMISLRPGDDVSVAPYQWIEEPGDRSVAGRLGALAEEPFDLVFVHRDADTAGWEAREREIFDVGDKRAVPVVPVVMTEAWALAALWDAGDFRRWLASHNGVRLAGIEGLRDPKQVLREYQSRESRGLPNAREFGRFRAELLRGIDIAGPVSELAAWRRLVGAIEEAVVRTRPYLGS